ncbi:MAG: hypothetical protein M3256_07975 [Actinomycetota bacterium]|nr:hypothetical protein [Actinomycetota bacterium]
MAGSAPPVMFSAAVNARSGLSAQTEIVASPSSTARAARRWCCVPTIRF